jgi:hypothetical protein
LSKSRKRGPMEWYPPPGSRQLQGATCRRSGTRFPAHGSFGGAMCRLGSSTRLPAQDSSGGATCPRGSSSHLPAQGSSEGATCPRGSHLSAQGSSGGDTWLQLPPLGSGQLRGATCPHCSRLRATPGATRVPAAPAVADRHSCGQIGPRWPDQAATARSTTART